MQTTIQHLQGNAQSFKALFKNLSPRDYTYRPNPNKWCLLEVLCHLKDEETLDFRARIGNLLENPVREFTPINPPSWVLDHHYMDQDPSLILAQFLQEREKSILWLNSVQSQNWEAEFHHSTFGKMTPKTLLSNWLAHDYLHMRQIIGLKFQILESKANSLNYAGSW